MEDIMLDFDDMDFFKIFTEKRLEMVKEIMEMQIDSIRSLAEKLDRDIKNVWEDLCVLRNAGVIGFQTQGRRKIPVVKKKRIVIMIR